MRSSPPASKSELLVKSQSSIINAAFEKAEIVSLSGISAYVATGMLLLTMMFLIEEIDDASLLISLSIMTAIPLNNLPISIVLSLRNKI
jgi:hypothetical protein